MLNLTDVTLADEDNNSIILADGANRAIPANVAICKASGNSTHKLSSANMAQIP